MGLQYRKLFAWAALGAGSISVHRIYFLFHYRTNEDWPDILAALFAGVRFDLASAPIATGTYILLLTLLAHFRGRIPEIASRVVLAMQILWLAIIHTALYASTFNFGVNEKLLGWEFFAYLGDLPNLYMGTFDKDIGAALFYASIPIAAITIAVVVFVRSGGFRSKEPEAFRLTFQWKALVTTVLVLSVITVMVRGGFQQSPIRTADAMTTDSPYLNNVHLNGIFTVINDSRDSLEFKPFFPEEENLTFINTMLGSGKISPEFPLLRKMPPRTIPGKARPNIVLVVLESFTAKFLEAHGYDPGIAPNLNRLIKQGVYFERFYATGGRSANGLFAMFTGIPDRAGRTILRSSQVQNRFGGLGTLLESKGYRTFFVHGGDLKFDNLNTALPHFGFTESYGRDEILKSGFKASTNVLGLDDADMFKFVLSRMDKGGPFMGVVFTQNTHYPYIAPDTRDYSRDRIQNLFLSSYHYVDSVIGQFVNELATKSYASDTIVLFVADHTHHAGLNYLEDRHIPFLIYAPGRFAPKRDSAIASQLDVLPAIVSLSGGNQIYAAMGTDIAYRAGLTSGQRELTGNTESFAFFAGGSNTNSIGWIEKNRIGLRWLDRDVPLLLTADPPIKMENLAGAEPAVMKSLLTKLEHYHQYARTLEKENRIWPEPEILAKLEKGTN
ncbi:MAG: LTA synthase family protein [Spirochaetia bacterium]|nr:LTA synthase family protein [Spirochaetia bacterium]